MEKFLEAVGKFSGWLWGFPLITLLVVTGVYLTIQLRFFQFRYPLYMFKQTFGSVLKKPNGEGDITPLQALTSALSSTIGAANIIGVPAAIMFGGPGAIFWMWIIAVIGMSIKFAESVLAVHYREKNEAGEYVGGPVYYMTKGLNMKWLGVWFAFALMIELIPSIMVQGNAVSAAVNESFNGNELVTGIVTAATTDHPVRQGFWAVMGIVIDTLIICSTTAFVVLSSGVWTGDSALDDPAALTTLAFEQYFGLVGSILVTVSLIFFVLSTIIVIIFYGSRQAEFLFGLRAGFIMKLVYLASIIIGSIGGAQVIWNFLDLALATILIPNVIAVLLLSGEVKKLKTDFFTSEQYYKKDIKKKSAS